MKDNLVSIAKIINFHGIKGEVKLGFTKGGEKRLENLKHVFVQTPDELVLPSDGRCIKLNIVSVRFHKNFAIVKFKEFSSINDIEPYKGSVIYAVKSEIEENLDENEYLISDLTGMDVYDEDGACIGSVCGIGENPANDLLEIIDNNNKKHLIPFVKAIVPVVDLKNRRIVINNIEGLIN